jgi:hypothetical protein
VRPFFSTSVVGPPTAPPEAKHPLDADMLFIGRLLPFAPLLAVREPSSDLAKKTQDSNSSNLTVAIDGNYAVLPPNFDVRRMRMARVCNVVISSYNAGNDHSLDSRLSRAIELLKKC